MTPDVSVYLAGSVRLLQGAVPYRDFVFVQPPGSTLLLVPFAALAQSIGTRDALAALRLLEPLIAAADVLLVARILRGRGPSAILTGALVVAVFPAELYALRGPMLEPWVVTLVLGAGALLAADRPALAGVLLGLAVSIKLTALLPAAVLLALCLRRPRTAALVAGVAAAAFAVVCLPFAVLAPRELLRDVLLVQAARVNPGDSGLLRYPQYPAVAAPVLAFAAGWLAARIRLPVRAAAALALAGLLLAGLGLRDLSAPDVAATVESAIPAGACVLTDSPRLTVTSDRFLSSKPGCSEMVDPFGTSLVYGPDSEQWQEAVGAADYVLSDRPQGPEVSGRFRLERRNRLWIYFR